MLHTKVFCTWILLFGVFCTWVLLFGGILHLGSTVWRYFAPAWVLLFGGILHLGSTVWRYFAPGFCCLTVFWFCIAYCSGCPVFYCDEFFFIAAKCKTWCDETKLDDNPVVAAIQNTIHAPILHTLSL